MLAGFSVNDDKHIQTPCETPDIWFASFLVCRGLSLTGTRVEGRARVWFQFNEDPARYATLRTDFWAGRDLVSARQLSDCSLRLKKLVVEVSR